MDTLLRTHENALAPAPADTAWATVQTAARGAAIVVWGMLMQAQTLHAAPVPVDTGKPKPALKTPAERVESDVSAEASRPEITAWLKKHHPDCTPELIQKLIADLDEDDFDTREKAQEALLAWVKKLAPAVCPLPHAFPAYSGGEAYSLEQRHRMARIHKAVDALPSRIPPQKLAAVEAVALLTAHTRNVIVIDPAGTEAVHKKLRDAGIVEIAPERNSFFESVGTICDKAGLHWRIDGMRVVLCDGEGTCDNMPLGVSGRYALLRDKASKEKAPRYTVVGEPAWRRVVHMSEACADEGDTDVAFSTTGMGPWANPYPGSVQPALAVCKKLDAAKGGKITLRMSAASSPFRRVLPLGGALEHQVGGQHLSPVRKQGERGGWIIDDKRIIWKDWNWSSSPWPADMQGWLLGAATHQTPLDAKRRPLTPIITGRKIDQRTLTTTMALTEEPEWLGVEGFGGITEETAIFELPPAEKK